MPCAPPSEGPYSKYDGPMGLGRQQLIRSLSRILYTAQIEKEDFSKIMAGFTDILYVTVFGKDAEEIRTDIGISKKANLRMYLDKEVQEKIDKIESLIAKDMSKTRINKLGDVLYFYIYYVLKHTRNMNYISDLAMNINDPVQFYKITKEKAKQKKWKHVEEIYDIFRRNKSIQILA